MQQETIIIYGQKHKIMAKQFRLLVDKDVWASWQKMVKSQPVEFQFFNALRMEIVGDIVNLYVDDKTLIPKQIVTGTTVQTSGMDMVPIEEALEAKNSKQCYLWTHSHVGMTCYYSQTDKDNIKDKFNDGYNEDHLKFLVALVLNNRGEKFIEGHYEVVSQDPFSEGLIYTLKSVPMTVYLTGMPPEVPDPLVEELSSCLMKPEPVVAKPLYEYAKTTSTPDKKKEEKEEADKKDGESLKDFFEGNKEEESDFSPKNAFTLLSPDLQGVYGNWEEWKNVQEKTDKRHFYMAGYFTNNERNSVRGYVAKLAKKSSVSLAYAEEIMYNGFLEDLAAGKVTDFRDYIGLFLTNFKP